jgi:hypothetical protein
MMTKLNIIIIGAGWYGCYAALLLQKLHNVTIIEKEKDIFEKSSFYNQNRLHLGYHYCRDYKTRNLCKKGFDKFISIFKREDIVQQINKNYYLISNTSTVDFQSIFSIYKYENYIFDIIKNQDFENINDNILRVNECAINSNKSKDFFTYNIICKKIFNKKVTKINYENDSNVILDDNSIISCDLIIDCTFNSLNLSSKKYIYEKTISLLYKKYSETNFDAITVIDGNFFSLYPHDISNNIYTLTDVEFTPLIKSEKLEHINNFVLELSIIDKVRSQMETKVNYYYKNFKDHFQYIGYFTSNKTKLISNSDSRECNIEKINDKLITINCGKITGIFEVEEYFKEISLI